ENQRIESVQFQMLRKPLRSALHRHGGALIDPAPVIDHDRGDDAAILGAPPPRGPVTSALFFKRSVAQKYHQPLSGERHMDVFQLRKSQVTAFQDAAGRMNSNMAA